MTGATGVLGRRVVPLLVAADHDATAIARLPQQTVSLERQGARPVTVSLFDREALRRAVRGHDVVLNLATRIPSGASALLSRDWRENDRIRREGPATVWMRH